MKIAKKKFMALLALTLIFVFSFLQMLEVYSEELSAEVENRALSFVGNVIGLDMTKYDAELYNYNSEIYNGLFREYVDYTLEYAGSKMRVMITFANHILIRWSIDPLEGFPLYAQPLPANKLDAVKGMLQRYQAYSKSSIIQEALNILGDVAEIKAMNITKGNLKMRITGNYIDWVRIVNGLEFPTGLSLSLNNGIVDDFVDETSFYRIGSADVNISQEEAVRISLEKAKTITNVTIWVGDRWAVFPFRVKEAPLMVRLQVGTANFTSYPYWYVWFVADPEVYSITGVEVYMRADTGEIAYCKTTGYYGVVPDANSPSVASPNLSASSDTKHCEFESSLAAYIIIGAAVTVTAVAVTTGVLKKRRK
ncbi:MAG: hypothetical protein QXJ40_02600 [Candidatus Bathyarchaeia archaeon]